MDRIGGSLFGLAYGDALGKATEFLAVDEIIRRYGPGGPRALTGTPAMVTDDTQMALAVAWALASLTGKAAPGAWTAAEVEPALRRRFVAWAHSPDNNRAPGNTCLRAVGDLDAGLRWQQASVLDSKGCGANMRVTPVGLLPGIDEDTVANLAQLQAGLTHGHPTALAASELTAYAVWLLVRGDAVLADLPRLLRDRAMGQRTRYRGDWLGDLWQRPGERSPSEFIARGWDECVGVLDRLDAALRAGDRETDPCLQTGAGWVAEEALGTALLCGLLFRDDPISALARAATTSGDSDSIACLTGAMLGAALGLAAWPTSWADQIEYADQLAALTGAFSRS